MVTKDRPTGALQRKPPSFHSNKLVLHYFTAVWACTFLTTLYVSHTQLLIVNMISQIQMEENIHTFGIPCIIVYNVSVKLTHFRMCGKRY
jgi:hypothetical protein